MFSKARKAIKRALQKRALRKSGKEGPTKKDFARMDEEYQKKVKLRIVDLLKKESLLGPNRIILARQNYLTAFKYTAREIGPLDNKTTHELREFIEFVAEQSIAAVEKPLEAAEYNLFENNINVRFNELKRKIDEKTAEQFWEVFNQQLDRIILMRKINRTKPLGKH